MRFSFSVDYAEAVQILRRGFQRITKQMPPQAAKIIAREMRQGKSTWAGGYGLFPRQFLCSRPLFDESRFLCQVCRGVAMEMRESM